MSDMLVNLLNLPPLEPLVESLRVEGIVVRRPNSFEMTPLREYIVREFGTGWADEAAAGFANKPASLFIAIHEKKIVGFAAYDCTRRDFFGPTGVTSAYRNKGIGKALLIASLWGLREIGYVYGIIGGAGPKDYYVKTVGATIIAGSNPGIYTDLLG
ncbi:MAG: GNAT family N-acetyltransferase [Armatimonadetes bacterium]|nr:GNAT family N-acetyltransferase [Armatimonadota bacterium]